jgi:putative chitinase
MSEGFTFNFTQNQLAQMIPGNQYVDEWYKALCYMLPKYEINTPQRVAAFVAQCAHESGNFRTLRENLNYSAGSLMRVWPSRFPTLEIANQYAMQPEKIANRAYADRMGNGPESSGDGWKYSGKGLIQLTGKDNYSRFAQSINMSIDQLPEYLVTFEGAVQSACWFWNTNHLNQFADSNDILTMTQRINGGTNGLEERQKNNEHNLQILESNSIQESVPVNTNIVLRRGSRGSEVAAMQLALGLTNDGDFGPATERALIKWQSENNLVPDGIAGPATLSKLICGK